MSFKQHVPWWAKVGAKVVLSRVPVGYRLWQHANLFVHGAMDQPDYALKVVRSHLARIGWTDLRGRVVLELGPGDSLATAVIGAALGGERIILVDAGAFATQELTPYRRLATGLRGEGLSVPDLESVTTIGDMLRLCRATYLTRGLDDLRALPPDGVDLVFSQAVLEHVRRGELDETLRQAFRVTRPGGLASHQIDLKDHLDRALNSLRFSDEVWEAEWMARSGFYTNRVRFSQMLALFAAAGYQYEVTDAPRWKRLPTPRRSLAPRFRELAEDDLLVSQFDILARKPG